MNDNLSGKITYLRTNVNLFMLKTIISYKQRVCDKVTLVISKKLFDGDAMNSLNTWRKDNPCHIRVHTQISESLTKSIDYSYVIIILSLKIQFAH